MSSTACHICSGSRAKMFMQKDGSDYYRCPDCKLEFIFPQPDNSALEKIYSEHYYDAWGLHIDSSAAEKSKRQTFEYRLKLVEHELHQGDKILDCGCATGFFLDLVKEKGFVPYGVEISGFAADLCRKKFGEQNIFLGDFEDAQFDSLNENMFSAIFMTDYLEHVRNPKKVLETAFRFLKTGGTLIITTPDTSSFSNKIMSAGWIHYKGQHLFYFAPNNLSLLLEQIRFDEYRTEKAWKYFTLEYIYHQFRTFKHPVYTPLVQGLHKIIPAVIRKKNFRARFGEMLIIVRKPL